jgi:flagellar hook-length control protein FliK
LASVSVVSSTDFRANLPQPQTGTAESDDPFSLMLNAVTDVKANLQRPEAPQVAERRSDVPAKQPKPEADADRQTKRQAKDTGKPEAKPQPETAAPAKMSETEEDSGETDTDTDSDETAAAEALLMIALGETQQQTVAQPAAAEADANVQAALVPAATENSEVTAEVQTAPVLAAAIADAAEGSSTQTAAAAQKPAKVEIQLEVSPSSGDDKIKNLSLPETAAEAILSKLKPSNSAAHFKLEAQTQVQTQPGSVNITNAAVLQGPAPLEMLNAAISKHVQLSLGFDANEVQSDAQRPMISSNAVAPNFAMTAQVNAPVQVQTQQVAEASRAVPLDQIAVEIATRAGKGERRFDIRLDPPELGRIDVRLEIDNKGNTTTKLIVERSETLDMLQRDARGLEKALQNAGLKLDAGGMQFSLQQDTQAQQGHQSHAPEMRGRPDLAEADAEIMTEISAGNASLAAQIRGGVDIRI